MSVDVVDLREFYATPLGHRATASIKEALARCGGIADGIDLVGLGYPLPVLESTLEKAARTVVVMPARQGAIQWPDVAHNHTCLADEHSLPLATASVQCVIAMHVLENTSDPAHVLEEVWRVLVPEGRLIVLATNRRGLWTRFEHTPFGNGRPFSRGQLSRLLRQARLTPSNWETCLNFPPIRIAWMQRLYPLTERVARRAWPVFCGAHLIMATKRLYQGVPASSRMAQRVAVPQLAPQGARIQSPQRVD